MKWRQTSDDVHYDRNRLKEKGDVTSGKKSSMITLWEQVETAGGVGIRGSQLCRFLRQSLYRSVSCARGSARQSVSHAFVNDIGNRLTAIYAIKQ